MLLELYCMEMWSFSTLVKHCPTIFYNNG